MSVHTNDRRPGGDAADRLLGGRYRLESLLGRGGMGAVWAGRDERLGREVAVKEVIPPPELTGEQREELRERTMREARAAARITSAAAVTVYDVVEEDGRPWIVMQRLHARTLTDVLAEEGTMEAPRAARIGLRVLEALVAAHRAGVLHRDVKPSNVMVTAHDDAVLTDFGIATLEGDPSMTATGMLIGSPSYISPERARGEPAGPAADLWSLGATLYYAVEGRAPFARTGQLATLTAVLTEDPLPPARAGALAPLLGLLLEKDPTRRLDADGARRMLDPVARQDHATAVFPVAAHAPVLDPAKQAEAERTRPIAVRPARDAQVPLAAASPARPGGAGAGGGRTTPGARPAAGAPTQPGVSRVLLAALALLTALALGVVVITQLDGGDGAGAGTQAADPPAPDASAESSLAPDEPASAPEEDTGEEAAPPAESPSAEPEPTPAQDPSAEPVGVPEGFRLHEDETGFSVAVPEAWTTSREGSRVEFQEPGTGRYLRVDQTDEPRGDPAADWRAQEESVSQRLAGYEQVSIEPVDYRGWDAARWEFTWTTEGGTPLHVANTGFVTAPDQAYALYWSVPENRWEESRQQLDAVLESFQPAG